MSGCDLNMLEKLLADKIVYAVLVTLCLLGNGLTKVYITYYKHTHNVEENDKMPCMTCSWSIKYATIGATFTVFMLGAYVTTIWWMMKNGREAEKNSQNLHFGIPILYMVMTLPTYLVLIMFLVKEKELTLPLLLNNCSRLLPCLSVYFQPPNHQRDLVDAYDPGIFIGQEGSWHGQDVYTGPPRNNPGVLQIRASGQNINPSPMSSQVPQIMSRDISMVTIDIPGVLQQF